MATSSQKNRYAFPVLLFLLFCLLYVFFFTEQTLEPSLSVYKDLLLKTPSLSPLLSSSPELANPPSEVYSPADQGTSETPIGKPISPISKREPIDSGNSSKSINGEILKERTNTSVSENEFASPAPVQKVKTCNLYMGTWVKDEEYPIYTPGSCPYVDEAFSCQSNGRRDSEYLKWRWKPYDCDLPR